MRGKKYFVAIQKVRWWISNDLKRFMWLVKKKGNLAPIERESKPKQEEIVDAILPPREWIENGKLNAFEIDLILGFSVNQAKISSSMSAIKRPQELMSLVWEKPWTRNWWRDKHVKVVFAPLEKNFSPNASMKSSVKLLWENPREVFYFWELETKSKWPSLHITPSIKGKSI